MYRNVQYVYLIESKHFYLCCEELQNKIKKWTENMRSTI